MTTEQLASCTALKSRDAIPGTPIIDVPATLINEMLSINVNALQYPKKKRSNK